MRENRIERRLVKGCLEQEAKAIKLQSSGISGLPDRLILKRPGKVWFVETKAPGKKKEPLQEYCCRVLVDLGFEVYCLSSIEEVDRFISEVLSK